MALPTGPIDLVVYDDLIEVAWGNSVAQSLNNLNQAYDQLFWVPDTAYLTPTTYASSGDLPDVWFVVGGSGAEITVPDWAHHVIANVQLNGVYLNDEGDATHDLQLQVGPNTGRRIRRTATQIGPTTDPDQRDWFGVSWVDRILCSSIEGDRTIKIRAGRYASTLRWGVDASSDVAVFLIFQGAIG